MIETEIKSRCDDHDTLRNALLSMGAEPRGRLRQRDLYLSHPCRDFGVSDEALRIRQEGESAMMHYKGPRRAGAAKSREEIAVPLDDAENMLAVLCRLGFSVFHEVSKEREIFLIEDCEVALDNVSGLGEYVEIEFIGNGDDGEERVLELAKRLGLKEDERRSYLELLLSGEGDA